MEPINPARFNPHLGEITMTTAKTDFKAPELLAASAVLLGLAVANCVQCFLEIDWKGLFAGVYAAGFKTKRAVLEAKEAAVTALETSKTKALLAAQCVKEHADPVKVFGDVRTNVISFKEEVLLLAKQDLPPEVSVLDEIE